MLTIGFPCREYTTFERIIRISLTFNYKWENTYKLGIRWNIAYSEWDDYRKQNGQDECIGNPQSRGIPTWFVLPDDMMFSEKFSGAMQRLDELRKGK